MLNRSLGVYYPRLTPFIKGINYLSAHFAVLVFI